MGFYYDNKLPGALTGLHDIYFKTIIEQINKHSAECYNLVYCLEEKPKQQQSNRTNNKKFLYIEEYVNKSIKIKS